jgi:hypothetical protein
MKKVLLFACFFIQLSANSQELEQKAVRAVIDRFFLGMAKNDSLISKEVVLPTAFLKSVMTKKSGEVITTDEPIQKLLFAIGTPHKGVYNEKLLSYDIKIDGPMAMAWTPYEFYVDETFSHCGVDVFLLTKQADGWKIAGIMDTRRKADCGH